MPDKKSKVNPRSSRGQKSKAQVPTSLKLRGASKSKKLGTKTKNPFEKKVEIASLISFARNDKNSRKTISKTSFKKTGGLSLDFFDMKGKVAETIKLPKEIFGAKINDKLMAQAVRVYLANQRLGTASTKTRGEVHGSTKKIWQQKGTGRARHGSRKAPIFVHGGIVFGPHPRDFSLKLSKKMKRLALFSALSYKLKKGEIKGITGFEKIKPKTKLMVAAIKNLGLSPKSKNVLLITASTTKEFENIYRAARNIESVNILNANLLNTYAILNSKTILLIKDSLKVMTDAFLKIKEIKNE